MTGLRVRFRRLVLNWLRPYVQTLVDEEIHVWGDRRRLKLAPTAHMVNTLFNTSSGAIEVGEYTFAGHHVSIITGTHNYKKFLKERMNDIPQGRDIVIGRGVWLGSNALVLGPCRIGDHAVIAAGCVILPGTQVEPYCVYAGVPGRCIKTLCAPAQTPNAG